MQTIFPNSPASAVPAHSPPSLRERVRARTRELTLTAGRAAHEVSRSDYERACREVTGETDPERQLALLDANEMKSSTRSASRSWKTVGSRASAQRNERATQAAPQPKAGRTLA